MNKHCLLLLALVLLGCQASRYDRAFELDDTTFDAETMQMIEADTGIDIPDAARGLNFAYTPPIDPAFIARIEIPKESVEAVRSQLEAITGDRIESSGGLSTRTAWWRPSQSGVRVDRQVFFSGNGSFLHVILTEEVGKPLLYIDFSR